LAGTRATLVVDDGGWEILAEPKQEQLDSKKHPGSGDCRPAHVRNFLDCVKSRKEPVENLELAHQVTTVAHLGNLAFRSGHKIRWDPETENVTDDPIADALVGVKYRAPWKLPYSQRA
jgi:hypothetical protein